jgi:uncharacterized protein
MEVCNLTRSMLLADRAELARSFWARGRGLLGRKGLAAGEGLVIYPNNSVHTFFMRFPIDVVFVDRKDRVVGLRPQMVPQRPFAGAWGAHYTIELPAGTIAATQTQLGDQLQLTPAPR